MGVAARVVGCLYCAQAGAHNSETDAVDAPLRARGS